MNDMSEMERWYAYGDENGNGPWDEWGDDDDKDENDKLVCICQNCDVPLTLKQSIHGALFRSEKRSGLVSEPHSQADCVMTRSTGMSYGRKLPQSSEREPGK